MKMKEIHERIIQLKSVNSKSFQLQYDGLWRTITSLCLKLDLQKQFEIQNSFTKKALQLLYNSQDILIIYQQMIRSQVLCQEKHFTPYQLQLVKHQMIQNIIHKLPQTDVWYLIECIVSMIEISYQRDQKNYQSISPKQKVLPYNFKPASPQRRLTPTLKITSKKDYSLEKLTLSKEKTKEFSLKSSKINIKKQLTSQVNQTKQQTTIQSNQIKFTLENKPQSYVRNYYLSVLMQTTPPRYKPQRFLKLDISKLSQKETNEGSPQQRILHQEKTQKLFKSLQTMKSDSEDEATDPKQPIQFRQESQGYLLRLVDGKNDIIQQESFESSEESVYNQVVEEIMENYDIQQKEIVTNRKSTVLSLNQENIDKIKRASLEQQLPEIKQNEGPKLRRGALSQKFKEMHLKLQLILGGGPQEIIKNKDSDNSEQTNYIEVQNHTQSPQQYYERGSLLPANRRPRTNEDQFLFNDL